jgi:hypothetical protein
MEGLNEVLDEMLFFLSKKENGFIINSGREDFGVKDEFSVPKGFFEWLVHDYKINDKYILDILKENKEIDPEVYKGIKDSYISVFDIIKTKNNVILKDIFSGNDFKLLEDLNIDDGGILLTRVYPYKDGYLLLENQSYSESFKTTFKKSILEKYNEYCAVYEPMDIEEFIKSKSLLVYKFYEVVENVIEADQDQEDLYVYQGTFMIQDMDKFNDIIKGLDYIKFDDEYESERIYKVYDDSATSILAEMVITLKKIEIECSSKDYLDAVCQMLDESFANSIVHVKNEVLSIDDIL